MLTRAIGMEPEPPAFPPMRWLISSLTLLSILAPSLSWGQMAFAASGHAARHGCENYPTVTLQSAELWTQQQSANVAEDSSPVPVTRTRPPRTPRPDFNREIYYRNKTEISLETGWLPMNIPFVFDFVVNSPYTTWPLHYTMVPNILSLRWHVDGIDHFWYLRGNWDFTFSGSYTAIPRGAETRYFAFDYGIRRNFVPPRSRIAPFWDMRGGIGDINAKGPHGVEYAQGQNMTFTLMLGSGARYNFSPRTSVEAGAEYMHVSNAYLSQPKYEDFGINVWGAFVGFNVRIGKEKHLRPY
jgi:hypothetical protein